MNLYKFFIASFILIFSFNDIIHSQEKHYYQTDFSKNEFKSRRSKIFNKIGNNSIALIQGGASVAG